MENTFCTDQNANMTVQRGNIVFVEFEPMSGSVTNGCRPALVISNDIGNAHSPTVIVAIITSKLKSRWLPTHLIVEYNEGLKRKSMLMLEQLRTIDKSRIVRKNGSVSANFMKRVDTALSISIGLDPAYNH